MKNVYLILLIVFLHISSFAQNENNHWQLGVRDFDFSTDPVTVNNNTGINTGYASISDTSGNLLFYTDGLYVWNKNHQSMGNLAAYSEADQKAVIVPHPGDLSKFYIISSKLIPYGNSSSVTRYSYSIVDFSENVLGELREISPTPSSGETLYSKYLRLDNNSSNLIENNDIYAPLTVAKDIANHSYWVIMQRMSSMVAFKIDNSGLNTIPVVSTFPNNTIYNDSNNQYIVPGIQRSMFRIAMDTNSVKLYGLESSKGYIPDGDPIYHTHRFYRLDFNISTGQFSNFTSISLPAAGFAYNFELSPDLQTAYFVTSLRPFSTSGSGWIYAKDLTSISSAPRLLYEYNNPTIQATMFSFLQKDKYGNLLVGSLFSTSGRNLNLHKIENPDSYANSTVNVNYVSLNNASILAFPQLIEPLSDTCPQDITLSITENNSSHTYQAGNSITSQTAYVVNSGQDITLKAGQFNLLKHTTHIKSGSVFLATIEECDSTNSLEYSARYASSGFEESQTAVTLKLSPNPARDEVLITSPKAIGGITITSFDGKVMYSRELSGKDPEQKINVSNFIKGIYLVTVKSSDGTTETAKLLKE